MVEQQLIDYIKKARSAGQADELSRSLLYKNGWTKLEVDEAMISMGQPDQTQPQEKTPAQPEYKTQPEVQTQPKDITQETVSTKIEIKSNTGRSPDKEYQSETQEQYSTKYNPKTEIETQPKVANINPIQSQTQTQPQEKTPAQPEYKPQPEVQTAYHPKKSFLAVKLLIVFIIILILGVIGYFVAGQYITLPWNPFKPNPKTVIEKMITNMQSVKSSQSVLSGEIEIVDNTQTSQGKISFNGSSKVDIIKPQADISFSVKSTQNINPTEKSPDLINTELKFIENTIYIKINETMIPLESGLDWSQIGGQWFAINQETFNTLKTISPAAVNNFDLSQANNTDLTQKIRNIIFAQDIISFNKELNSEAINGQDSYHYLLTISKDKLNTAIIKIADIQIDEMKKSDATIDEEYFASLKNSARESIKYATDTIGDINIEAWIGKKDYMLYGVKIEKNIDFIIPFFGTTITAKIKFNTNNSAFNQPLTVQKPDNFKNLEEIILPLVKKQLIQSSLYGVSQFTSDIYNVSQNYYALCNKGYLNGYEAKYGKQLIEIAQNIKDNGGKNPVCFAGTRGFCISTELTDGTYLCIDESTAIGNVKCTSSTTVCNPPPSM